MSNFDFVEKVMTIGGADTPPLLFYKKGFNLGGSSQPTWQDIILSGNTALTLVNAKANSLEYLKLFGGTEQRNLPSEYTQVEYLASSGTQYIDTGIVPTNTTGWKVTLNMPDVQTDQAKFGCRDSGDARFWFGCNAGKAYFGWGTNYPATEDRPSISANVENTVSCNYLNDRNCVLNDTIIYSNLPTLPFTSTKNIWLFGVYVGTGTYRSYKLSEATFTEGNAIIMHLIPAKRNSDNVLGFYDTVGKTFLTNQGTGTFTAGSDIVPTPDNPIDIVCNNGVVKVSKNLFDYRYFYANYVITSTSTVGRLAIRLKPNTQYTLSTNTQSSSTSAQIWVVSGNNTSFTPNTSVNGVLIDSPRTVTSDNSGYICLGIRTAASSSIPPLTEQDFINGTVWLQIEEGAIATSYRPYGQIYTDGTTETVEITGKNLFNRQWRAGIYDTVAGRYNPNTFNRICNVDMIQIEPSTKYTVSCPSYTLGTAMRWLFYDANKNFISASTTGATTITTPANAKYINFYIANNLTVETAPDLQIEKGSTATTYEPYFNGGTATAENLFKVDTYRDIQSVIDGGVIRNVGVLVLNGTETVTKTTSTSAPLGYYFGIETGTPHRANALFGFCTNFTITKNSAQTLSDNTFALGSNQRIWFATSKFTEASDFQQWLAEQYTNGTPVIVVYSLATPTTETVTPQPMNIQAGTNIVEITQASIDNLGLEVKYKATV